MPATLRAKLDVDIPPQVILAVPADHRSPTPRCRPNHPAVCCCPAPSWSAQWTTTAPGWRPSIPPSWSALPATRPAGRRHRGPLPTDRHTPLAAPSPPTC
jgi:hypothetical protein